MLPFSCVLSLFFLGGRRFSVKVHRGHLASPNTKTLPGINAHPGLWAYEYLNDSFVLAAHARLNRRTSSPHEGIRKVESCYSFVL